MRLSVPHAVQDAGPEFGALVFAYPHAQYVLASRKVDADGNVGDFRMQPDSGASFLDHHEIFNAEFTIMIM